MESSRSKVPIEVSKIFDQSHEELGNIFSDNMDKESILQAKNLLIDKISFAINKHAIRFVRQREEEKVD